ncbi:MarR family transcriptional regulator [Listeria sp. FSL L7-1509]|uniref:MarR family transcriptional regulator n=1 Tax=Listeria immobilis TaxID=2713502 RepID=A0ABR6ST71_9LIST|nr:MarR family transcriptional regulator [Listeria immobilis]MBC1482353.1 MarR family transcriptional regulator [Listeria immobilis]MBC1506573.1 MarR family transcriptional regulator [Listeria immobilis]MBC1508822.1 MarR family transcriptional regulator [Listeria immobilis]MBC6311523.1 MarR family transcriptional regulator [Listeria immobilis]
METYLEIETLIKRIFNSFRHEVEAVLDKRLSGSEYRVLSLISSGLTKTSELAKALDVSASHITAITDTLVEEAYITRHRSEVDRRIIELRLTPEAEKFVKEIDKKKKEMIVKRFAVFSEQEQAEFRQLLKKLADGANQ